MKPDISEFSYGYALTDELIHWEGTALTAAPVFPSLYKEGQPGGGYDVMLQRPGLPLFLQFKLSDCMVRSNAQEIADGTFAAPCYRMHIRPSRHSQQHEMLLDLENRGDEVYYCAPAFHTPEELNEAYLNHMVRARSLWLSPSRIGLFSDGGAHYVAFQTPQSHRVYSRPRQSEGKSDFEEFTRSMEESYRERSRHALTTKYLEHLAGSIAEIAKKRKDISPKAKMWSEERLASRHPLVRIAFYASVFMDCQFFIVTQNEDG